MTNDASKRPQFLDVVSNVQAGARVWRLTAFFAWALVAVLAFSLVYQSRNTPVVLVPYDLAANNGRMQVAGGGEIRGTSLEYMANVALSDLSLILDFTPDNVLLQHRRFLNRMTESLYGQQSAEIQGAAEDLKRRGVTQSFNPTDVKLLKDGTRVEVTGTQIRYQGGKETVRSNVTYVLTYKVFKGYMHVADLRQKSDAN